MGRRVLSSEFCRNFYVDLLDYYVVVVALVVPSKIL